MTLAEKWQYPAIDAWKDLVDDAMGALELTREQKAIAEAIVREAVESILSN